MSCEVHFCQNLLVYLMEASYQMNIEIRQHLSTCARCQKEYQLFRQVMDILPYEMDELDIPAQWKYEIVSNIVHNR